MPIIQQQGAHKIIKGLPERWGRRAYRELKAEMARGHEAAEPATIPYCGPSLFVGPLERVPSRYDRFCSILDQVTSAPLPVDASDAHLCVLAARYAADCAAAAVLETVAAPAGLAPVEGGPRQIGARAGLSPRERMANICAVRGIQAPKGHDDAEAVARCIDPAWWRRNLRKVHGRAFETAAIRLGFVSSRAGAYASDETVSRRVAQIARNKAALASVQIQNEDGFAMGLDEAAAKTTSNKRIRRGELMLRLAGCEDIAIESGHVGLFITITAPSKFHAVLEKSGQINPKYVDATPRDVAEYLQKTWAKIRSAYGKYGIRPYGFRIAEPHHDGCVHWHMLLFMRPVDVEWVKYIVEGYGLAVDGNEPGAAARRVTFETIDSTKGSAAAYIAKYISKNIDDDEDHSEDEVIGPDGQPVKLVIDKTKRASQRVDAWAGVWGIRQFQPIGQPPVTVWRELRRVKEAAIAGASEHVRQAWDAAQRVTETDADGVVTVVSVARFGEYIRAQGGVCQGRDYRIGLAVEAGEINGRYGLREGERPIGIEDRRTIQEGAGPYMGPEQFTGPARGFFAVYSSVRHTWVRVEPKKQDEAAGRALAFPWSPVNNCTEGAQEAGPHWWAEAKAEPIAQFDEEELWFATEEFQRAHFEPGVIYMDSRPFIDPATTAYEMLQAEDWAKNWEANRVDTVLPGTLRMIAKQKERARANGQKRGT